MDIFIAQGYMLTFGVTVGENSMKAILQTIVNWFNDLKQDIDDSYMIDDAYMELGMDEKMGRGNE